MAPLAAPDYYNCWEARYARTTNDDGFSGVSVKVHRSRFPAMLLAALILTASAMVACAGSDRVSGRIGETLTAGDFQLVVSNMENPAERPDRFTNPKIGYRHVKFDVVVSNLGQQHLPVAAGYFTLKDSSGSDNPVIPGVPSDRGLRMTSLSPGQKLDTTLYFEMPSNANPTQLVFSPAVVGWRTRIEVNLQ